MAVNLLVAYDIASSSRRARLATTLQAWGDRLQESVFHLRVEDRDVAEIRESIGRIIKPTDDVVHIYTLCRTCVGKVEVLGTVPTRDDGELYRGLW